MTTSCLNCIHKDVCLKRSIFIFQTFIVTGRHDEVADAQKGLDIGAGCENWMTSEGRNDG